MVKSKPWIQGIAAAVLCLALLGCPAKVTVPDVTGMTQAAASAAITGANLSVGAITEEYNTTVAAGMVIRQNPAAGASASSGASVALTLSKGPQPAANVTVPNVVGMMQAAASTAITGANLTVGTVTQEFSATVAVGMVMSQNPSAGASAAAGAVVALTVSKGPQSVTDVTVPNVVGMTQAAASTAITGANLTVGTVAEACSATVAAGNVISQSPAGGASAASGTAVALVVSTGPCGGTDETVQLSGNVPMTMIWVPGGTFTMGSPDTEADRSTDESPQHTVTLGGFWMGKYELTKRQWTAVMGTTPWAGEDGVLDDPDSPAVYVSWGDTQSFLTALNGYTGKSFRLPSEAQWEYACRAGTTTQFYWGNDPDRTAIGDYAWYDGNAMDVGQGYAHVVGQKLPNTFGLFDMSGNAWEWCQDYYHTSYTDAPTDGSVWESPASSYRVLRGGAFSESSCRTADRFGFPTPDNRHVLIGFRVVRLP